jgi:hypothetical protein
MHLSPARDRLPLLFPGIAYPDQAPTVAGLASEALDPSGDSALSLQRAYLARWGVHGDANFSAALAALGLSLNEEAA